VAFKHPPSGKVLVMQAPFEIEKLEWIMMNYVIVGFNCFKYDTPLIWASVFHQSTRILKSISNDLIYGRMWRDEVAHRYQFHLPRTKMIDLIEVCPLRGSLKLYGARLHAPRIQDVPWADQQELEEWQIPITVDYCVNDLDNTQLLLEN